MLRILSDHVNEVDVRRFVDQTKEPTDPGARNNIDAVLQVSILADQALCDRPGREQDMSDVVRQYFRTICKDDLAAERSQGMQQGMHTMLYSLVYDGLLSLPNGAARANMSEAVFTENMNRMYP